MPSAMNGLRHLRPRFRLASLLWLTLCVGAVIAAYRSGHRNGFELGRNLREDVGYTFPRKYAVADLVHSRIEEDGKVTVDLEPLLRDLRAMVLPHTWQEAGGNAAVMPYYPNLEIVVLHDLDGQQRVEQFLVERRTRMTTKWPLEWVARNASTSINAGTTSQSEPLGKK